MAKHKRKKLYVDSNVQFALLLQAVFHWLLFVTATFVLLFYLQILTGGPFESISHHLNQMWIRHAPAFVVFLVLTPVVIRDSIKLSNRVAGPVYRLRTTLKEMVKGNQVSPIHFRKNDFWQDLAKDFNIIIDRVQSSQVNSQDSRDDGELLNENEGCSEHEQVPQESA